MSDHPHPVDAAGSPGPASGSRAGTEGVTSVLTLIADPTRMRLLFALDAADELCVGDLALALGPPRTPWATGCGCCARPAWSPGGARAGWRTTAWSSDFPEPLRQHCLIRLAELGGPGAASGDPD